jgi:hypothetical protein
MFLNIMASRKALMLKDSARPLEYLKKSYRRYIIGAWGHTKPTPPLFA